MSYFRAFFGDNKRYEPAIFTRNMGFFGSSDVFWRVSSYFMDISAQVNDLVTWISHFSQELVFFGGCVEILVTFGLCSGDTSTG